MLTAKATLHFVADAYLTTYCSGVPNVGRLQLHSFIELNQAKGIIARQCIGNTLNVAYFPCIILVAVRARYNCWVGDCTTDARNSTV